MVPSPLTRNDVVKRLQSAEAEIRGYGVRRLALFGSIPRGEARPDSDVDLLVEAHPGEKSFDGFLSYATCWRAFWVDGSSWSRRRH